MGSDLKSALLACCCAFKSALLACCRALEVPFPGNFTMPFLGAGGNTKQITKTWYNSKFSDKYLTDSSSINRLLYTYKIFKFYK